MKATINREAFTRAYGAVSACVPRNSPKPILQSIRFRAAISEPEDMQDATLEATDLDVGIRYALSGVVICRPGSVLLPQCFGEILRTSTEDELSLELDDGNLTVRGLHSEFTLATEDASLFPDVPGFDGRDCYECGAMDLATAIEQTIFASDQESTRYALGGCLFEIGEDALSLVATDGRRLAKAELTLNRIGDPKPPHSPPVVSVKTLKMLSRMGKDSPGAFQFCFHDSWLRVRTEHATLSGQLVEGRFPKYQDVFPTGKTASIEIACGPFRQALSQASIATSEDSRGVDFAFGPGMLVLASKAATKGASRVAIPLNYDGQMAELTFDPSYLVQGLKALDEDALVTLELFGENCAVVLRAGQEWCYVVMPLTRDA